MSRSVIVHLVREGDCWPKLSVCGAALCGRGRARSTTRRNGSDCRACAAAVLPGSFGGTADDPDSIDVGLARNAVDHYTRRLAEPRTIVRA